MLSPVIAFKEELKSAQAVVIDAFKGDHKAEQLLHSLCRNVDHTLEKIWKHFDLPKEYSLVAVGGYGRGELFPYSDVDVLILLNAAPDSDVRNRLENFVQLLWDIGLDIGHSIRTVDECLEESAADITVQTSLLEARLITGSRKLFRDLQERYAAAMNPQKFFQEKLLELQQRHVKYEDTP